MNTEPWSDYALDAPEPGRVRDLDETRRLLYMSLYASQTDRYALVGTIVNALAHHSAKIAPDVSAPALVALVNTGEDDTWVREQIATITGLLGDG
jgi:hypothetical protein